MVRIIASFSGLRLDLLRANLQLAFKRECLWCLTRNQLESAGITLSDIYQTHVNGKTIHFYTSFLHFVDMKHCIKNRIIYVYKL